MPWILGTNADIACLALVSLMSSRAAFPTSLTLLRYGLHRTSSRYDLRRTMITNCSYIWVMLATCGLIMALLTTPTTVSSGEKTASFRELYARRWLVTPTGPQSQSCMPKIIAIPHLHIPNYIRARLEGGCCMIEGSCTSNSPSTDTK